MKSRPHPDNALSVLGVVPGLLCVVGGLALLWGSQDAMLVLIHWVGEERALGARSVIPRPGGGKLLTNPGAMAGWMALIWAVGVSQVLAGADLIRRAARATQRPGLSAGGGVADRRDVGNDGG
jgi:hypothetical protein